MRRNGSCCGSTPWRRLLLLAVLLPLAAVLHARERPVVAVYTFAAGASERDEAHLISDVLRSDLATHAEVRVVASGAVGEADGSSTRLSANYVVTGRVVPVGLTERGIVARLTSVDRLRVLHAAYRVIGADRPGPQLSALADELVLAVIADGISAGPRRVSRLVALDRYEEANRAIEELEANGTTAAELRREVDEGLAARLRARMSEKLSRGETVEARSLLPLYLAYTPSAGADPFLSEFYTELDSQQRDQFDQGARAARRALRRGETVRAARLIEELDRLGRTVEEKTTVTDLDSDLALVEHIELLRSSRRARWNGRHEEAKITAEEALARLPQSARALANVATVEDAADRRDRRIRRREAQPALLTPGIRDPHSLSVGFSVLLLDDPARRTLVDGAFPSYSLSYETRRPIFAPPLHRSFGGRIEFATGSDTYSDGNVTLDSRFTLIDARARAGLSAAFWRHDITLYGEAGLTTLLRRGASRGDTAAVEADRTAPGALFAVGIEPTWYFNHRLAVGLRAERAVRLGIAGSRFPSTIVGVTMRVNAGLGQPEAEQPPAPWWATR